MNANGGLLPVVVCVLVCARLPNSSHALAVARLQDVKRGPAQDVPVAPDMIAIQAALAPSPAAPVASAPWPSPAEATTRPPLIAEAQQRLRADHQTLGSVTSELFMAQTRVTDLEEVLFGNVVGLDSVQALSDQHEILEASNSKLVDDIQRLTAQLEGLSMQVAQMQRSYVDEGNALRAEETRLRGRTLQNRAAISGVKAEVQKGDHLAALNEQLSGERNKLVNESKNLSTEGSAVVAVLSKTRQAIWSEEAKQDTLRDKLRELNQIGIACHDGVQKAKTEFQFEKAAIPKQQVVFDTDSKQAAAAYRMGQKRLEAEGAIIRQQVIREESAGQSAFHNLTDMRHVLQQLEDRLVADATNVTDRINATQVHTEIVRSSLEVNQGEHHEATRRKNELLVKLAVLQKKVSPITYAALRAENDVYQGELNELEQELMAAKGIEASSTISCTQVDASISASRSTLAATTASLEKARADSKTQVDEALAEAKDRKTKAAELEHKAKARVASLCGEKWEERGSDKHHELEECEKQEQTLTVVNAQKEALEQALKAQQLAAAAEAG